MARNGKYIAILNIQTALGFVPENFPQVINNRLVDCAPITYEYVSSVLSLTLLYV